MARHILRDSHRDEKDPIPAANDWWVNQHLMRGFNVNGQPYGTGKMI